MHGHVANVDLEWYEAARSLGHPDELNLWRAGTQHGFRALAPGEPLFFRLKSPHDRIVGYGRFSHFSVIPLSLAWRIYGRANGSMTIGSMHRHLLHLREQLGHERAPAPDPDVASILLRDIRLLPESSWIEPPSDFDERAGQGKRYDLTAGEGKALWEEMRARVRGLEEDEEQVAQTFSRYGSKSFRVAVLDAWDRRCAATGEGVVTALEAVQISPEISGSHSLSNGILFRADLAWLYLAGHLTVTPEHVLLVSRVGGRDDLGRDYDRLHGTGIRLPTDSAIRPDPELLWWHQRERFAG